MKKPTVFVIGLSGESLFFEVDHFNKSGETVIAKDLHTEPGGKGFNQAMALKKLGADVHFLTITGDDDYAVIIENTLHKLGIIPHLIKVKGKKTTRAAILTDKQGDNMVCVYPGMSNDIAPDVLDGFEELIGGCDYLLMQQEYPLSLLKRGIEIARRGSTKVVINPAPANSASRKVLEEVDIITPNESEAKVIFNVKDSEPIENLIEKIKESAFEAVIVTLGSKGSIVYNKGIITKISALTVEAVDTTGAGDIYNASLIYKLACGSDLETSARFAGVVSGLSVKKKYVLNAVPSKEEIEETLKKEKL